MARTERGYGAAFAKFKRRSSSKSARETFLPARMTALKGYGRPSSRSHAVAESTSTDTGSQPSTSY
jgi:hypothetical protein